MLMRAGLFQSLPFLSACGVASAVGIVFCCQLMAGDLVVSNKVLSSIVSDTIGKIVAVLLSLSIGSFFIRKAVHMSTISATLPQFSILL